MISSEMTMMSNPRNNSIKNQQNVRMPNKQLNGIKKYE